MKCALTRCAVDVNVYGTCCAEHHAEWRASGEPLIPIGQWVHQQNHSGEVVYEAWFRESDKAYARLGRALLHHKVKLVDSFILTGTPVVLLKGTPAAVRAFGEAVRLNECRYRSPTIFDNGTLVTIYASPEDDIAGKKTRWALDVERRQEKERDR